MGGCHWHLATTLGPQEALLKHNRSFRIFCRRLPNQRFSYFPSVHSMISSVVRVLGRGSEAAAIREEHLQLCKNALGVDQGYLKSAQPQVPERPGES